MSLSRETQERKRQCIKLEWQGTPSDEDTTKFEQDRHRQVNVLDLDALRGALVVAPGGAPDESFSTSVIYMLSRWGCFGGPKIVGMSDPCCDPSAAELTSRTLGPFQTLYESLNRFISVGGNDHNSRLQTGPGRERSESRAGASTIADI